MSLSLVAFIVILLVGVAMVLDGIKIILSRTYVFKKFSSVPFFSKLEPMKWEGAFTIPIGISVCLSGLVFIFVSLMGVVYSSNNVLGGIAIMAIGGGLAQLTGNLVAHFMRG